MSDLAGLDIGWSKGATTADPLRDALFEHDWRGQNTSSGYYDYDKNRARTPSSEVAELIKPHFSLGDYLSASNDEKIVECGLFMVNEGAKILEKKTAQRPSDIDVVWMFGYNWPRVTGGPMRWADSVG